LNDSQDLREQLNALSVIKRIRFLKKQARIGELHFPKIFYTYSPNDKLGQGRRVKRWKYLLYIISAVVETE
jgi:hypothetical protein